MPLPIPGAARCGRSLTALVLLAGQPLFAATDDAPLPAVIFAGDTVTLASLSPDGRHLAVAITEGEATRIEITPLDDPDQRHTVHLGAPPNPRITAFIWAGDGTLVFSTEDWVIAAVRPGQPVPEKLADPASLESQFSAPLVEAREAGTNVHNDYTEMYRLPRMPRLLGSHPTDPHAVLIESVSGDSFANADFRTHTLDTRNGEASSLDWRRINHSNTTLLSDAAGRIRLLTERMGDAFSCQVRIDTDGNLGRWRPIEELLPADWGSTFAFARATAHWKRSVPLAWDGAGNTLIFAANHEGTGWALWTVELGNSTPPRPHLTRAGQDTVWLTDYGPPRHYGRQEQRAREVVPAMRMTDFAPHALPTLSVPSSTEGSPIFIDRDQTIETVWLQPEWRQLESVLARDFSGRQATVLDWSTDHRRWLIKVESGDRPARLFVHDQPAQRWVEYYRTAPDRTWDQRNLVEHLVIDSPDGAFHVRLTQPHAPRISQPPLVCLFNDEPWERPNQGFNPTVHYFADSGAWVLEVESPLRAAALPAPPEDTSATPPGEVTARRVSAALEWLVAERNIRPAKLAAVGHGFGGWLALRTAGLMPGRFHAAVALNHANQLHEYFYAPEFESRGLRPDNETPQTVATSMAVMEGLKAQREQLGIPADPLAGGFNARGAPDMWNDGANDEREPNIDTLAAMTTRRVMTGGRTMREWRTLPMQPLLLQQSLRGLSNAALDHSLADDAAGLPAHVLLGFEEFNPYLRDNPSGQLARALKRHDKEVERWLIPESSGTRSLDERADVWRHVAAYLAANLYHYDVHFGPTQRVP